MREKNSLPGSEKNQGVSGGRDIGTKGTQSGLPTKAK